MTTTIATAVASFVWPLTEWIVRGKPSVLGFCSGVVAGLVVVTPACGFITPGGALLTGFLARNPANANLATNLKDYVKDSVFQPLVLEQFKAIAVTLVLAIVGTVVIAYIVKAVVGLRVAEEVEVAGLDLAEHGEVGYHQARG